MKKRILSLSLATTLLLGTVACASSDKVLISESPDKEVINVEGEVAVEKESNYIQHEGKITEVNSEDGTVSIIVDEIDMLNEGDQVPTKQAIKFNISEDTVVLSDETQDLIKTDKLIKGSVVEVSYKKDSPMTMSIPPMTNADVIVLRQAKEDSKELGIKVDTFDKEHTSIDNFLKYTITEETVIVDSKGKKLTEKDVADKNLVVFYGPIATMSIPAQSDAVKIIVLGEEDKIETPEKSETPVTPETPEVNTEIKSLDKIIYNGKEIKLENKIYKSGDVFMMPFREVGEALGYKVSWQSASRQAELTKGANQITATEDKDMYSFAKMIVKLGKAPEIKSGTMFVPVNLIDEAMQLEMEVSQDGVINIK